MNSKGFGAAALALALLTGLAGFGGSSQVAEGGIGGTGVTQGPVTGFGSVFVNGVEFETTGVSIDVNGVPLSEDSLAVGMVVTVTGTVNPDGLTGTAKTIVYEDQLRGPVQAVGPAQNTLTVLGQTVVADADTILRGTNGSGTPIASLADILPGDLVEVSGYHGADARVHATRVAVKGAWQSAETIELKGVITTVETSGTLFNIGGLTVDYGAPTVLDLPGGTPAIGQYVGVKGSFDAAGSVVNATEVHLKEEGVSGEAGADVEMEGVVTGAYDGQFFWVNGQKAQVQATTVLEPQGSTANDLLSGVKIEVEGQLDANGTILADHIHFRPQSTLEFSAQVTGTTATSLTVLGKPVQVNSLTVFEDRRELNPERYFRLAHILVGDYVEVRAYQDAGGLVATRIEREDASASADEVELQGPVDSVTPATGSLTILGIPVTTGEFSTVYDGGAQTQAEFFTAVKPGDIVHVTGTGTGTGILAAELNIEN